MSYSPRRRWAVWLRWPDEEAGPYYVGLTWSAGDGEPLQLVGVELWSRPPAAERATPGPEPELADLLPGASAPEVRSRLLHDLPLGQLARQARQQLLEAFMAESSEDEVLQRATDGLRGGKPRLTREFFAAVVDVYRWAIGEGLDATAAIQERWPASKSTVGHWIHRARNQYGLLPPTTRGQRSA